MNERNGLDDLGDERCVGSYLIGRLLAYDGHSSSIMDIRALGVVGLDVVRSRASDGVVRILMMQMLVVAVAVCVSKFVCGMSVSVRTAASLKE